MYVRYDPVFRHLTGSETGGPELGSVLAANGVTFFETPSLPGPLDQLAYNAEDNTLVWRQTLPTSCLLEDIETSDEDAAVPEIPELPNDAVVEPPVGTPLASGETYVTVRAPYCFDYRFRVRKWTTADEQKRLTAWAANRRWELMQLGATWEGHRVATDDVSQSRMTAAVLASQIMPQWETRWQFLDGSSATVNGPQVVQMALTAQAYVNNLFVTYNRIKDQIASGEITTEAQIEILFNLPAVEQP